MARRLIGLDVGTNAVTIAEVTPGTPPRLDMFGQVALAREAMREGEVADEGAVADAVARLKSEVGLKKAAVRVGVASPRVIVRQVEMPVMTRDELASALQFQAGELIPISVDDAVLDFAILGTTGREADAEGRDEPTMQVLLAAAQEASIMRLVTAVEAGGLQVAAVDLIPLALTRALARPLAVGAAVGGGGVALAEEPGAEGIVSFGGGVTAIAVHEGGVPRFVRVIGSGGRELTDAVASELNVPAETAEALKRAVGTPGEDEMVQRARAAIDRPLSVLLDEVRSSIDYFRNQPGAARLTRVVATGGSAQIPGIMERMSALVGVPVEPAYMHDLIRVGNIGFSSEDLPRLEPYLPAAVGLALGGAGVGTVVDLLPRVGRRTATARPLPRLNVKVGAAVVAGVVLLGGATFMQRAETADAKKQRDAAEAQLQELRARLELAQRGSASGANLQQELGQLLGADVAWTTLVADIGRALPAGVWLTSFQGAHTLSTVGGASAPAAPAPPAAGGSSSGAAPAGAGATGRGAATPGAAAPGAASGTCAAYEQPLAGTVSLGGIATSVTSLSDFLDALAKLGDAKNPDVTRVWLTNAQTGKFGDADVITFQASAELADGARSERLTTFLKEGALCK
jgi:type IV pilus assembly protein PilM